MAKANAHISFQGKKKVKKADKVVITNLNMEDSNSM